MRLCPGSRLPDRREPAEHGAYCETNAENGADEEAGNDQQLGGAGHAASRMTAVSTPDTRQHQQQVGRLCPSLTPVPMPPHSDHLKVRNTIALCFGRTLSATFRACLKLDPERVVDGVWPAESPAPAGAWLDAGRARRADYFTFSTSRASRGGVNLDSLPDAPRERLPRSDRRSLQASGGRNRAGPGRNREEGGGVVSSPLAAFILRRRLRGRSSRMKAGS